MRPPRAVLRSSGSPFALALILMAPLPLAAQEAQHFVLAAGPAFAIDDAPPDAGAHVRGSLLFGSMPRTLNLVADAYVTWLAPGTQRFVGFEGPVDVRRQETQVGLGLNGMISLLPSRAVSPYFLVGGVVRWSHLNGRVTVQNPELFEEADASVTRTQADILLGVGAAVRRGGHRLLFEARLYGGSVIYAPLTVGFTF